LRHPSGETFAGLLQQNARGGAEQQELPGDLARPAPDVDDAAQHGEEFRHALHFVQDHQPIPVHEQECLRIIHLTLGRGQFQVEVKRVPALFRFGQG
jgi:hypothetical protein